jgi:hypothetical protein
LIEENVMMPAVNADEREADWRALINLSWAKDWCDPREDIYTLEDVKPSDECR